MNQNMHDQNGIYTRSGIELTDLMKYIAEWYLSEGLAVPSDQNLSRMAEAWGETLVSVKPNHIKECFFIAKRDGGRPSASHILKVYAKHRENMEYMDIQNDPDALKQLSKKTSAQHDWEVENFQIIKANWEKWIKDGSIKFETLEKIGITKEMYETKFQDYYHFKSYRPLNFNIMDVDF